MEWLTRPLGHRHHYKSLSTIADRCEGGLTGIYEQRRYQVSSYVATTRLGCAGRGGDVKDKLKHRVPLTALRGGQFFFLFV